MQRVLMDSSVIVALLDKRERYHHRCLNAIAKLRPPLYTCEAVISESCYLLASNSGAAEDVLESVVSGTYLIPFQLSCSALQIQAILHKYRDTPASFADACLIHMADELDTGDILTLDSDFMHYRWKRARRFNLLIPLD
jgi:predicted nucleic acid-binding protein